MQSRGHRVRSRRDHVRRWMRASSVERGSFGRHAIAGLATIGVIGLVLLGAWSEARSAMVAPHAVFMDHRTRSAVFYVINEGESQLEVEVELRYGYPTSDGEGGVRVALFTDPAVDEPSAAAWVRALPRRLMLAPGQRQAVRLLARPPAGLEDGEYWSRILVTSREANPEPAPTSNQNIQVGLTMATRTITSLNYRKGDVRTGVDLRRFAAYLDEETLTVDLDLLQLGNAAYLGQLDLRLVDEEGEPVGEWSRALAVYRDLSRRYTMGFDDFLPWGDYRLLVRLSTDRDDIPSSAILPAEELIRSVALRVGEPQSN